MLHKNVHSNYGVKNTISHPKWQQLDMQIILGYLLLRFLHWRHSWGKL